MEYTYVYINIPQKMFTQIYLSAFPSIVPFLFLDHVLCVSLGLEYSFLFLKMLTAKISCILKMILIFKTKNS